MPIHEKNHAAEHTDGTDDIQDATASQKGLATAVQAEKLDKISLSVGGEQIEFTNSAGDILILDAYRSSRFYSGQINSDAPASLTAHANYNTVSDADFDIYGGSATGTLYGSATVGGGTLNLNNSNQAYVIYSGTSNCDSQQVGTCRIGIKPNYSGSPAANQTLYTIVDDTSAPAYNLIRIRHLATGYIQIRCSDSAGTLFINDVELGTFSPTSGQLYDIEFNYDFTTGATRLFIDGTQLGSTITSTGTRSSSIAALIIGDSPGLDQTANFKADYVSFYNTVQHTSGFTPDSGEFADDICGITFQNTQKSGIISSASGHGLTETSEYAVVHEVRSSSNHPEKVFGITENYLELYSGKTLKTPKMQVDGNIGFYGTSPVAKPEITGSAGSNAALQSLLTALENMGLITDSAT